MRDKQKEERGEGIYGKEKREIKRNKLTLHMYNN